MVKSLTSGYNAGKEKTNLKKGKGATNTKPRAKKMETKQKHFACKCGWVPGTCQVEVVKNDKMVIHFQFIPPLLFTFDKLPSPILSVPAYLF